MRCGDRREVVGTRGGESKMLAPTYPLRAYTPLYPPLHLAISLAPSLRYRSGSLSYRYTSYNNHSARRLTYIKRTLIALHCLVITAYIQRCLHMYT